MFWKLNLSFSFKNLMSVITVLNVHFISKNKN